MILRRTSTRLVSATARAATAGQQWRLCSRRGVASLSTSWATGSTQSGASARYVTHLLKLVIRFIFKTGGQQTGLVRGDGGEAESGQGGHS